MTAAKVQPIAEAAPVLPVVTLDALRIAPWNARKTFDQARMAELVASIQEHGIQVPFIVRPIPIRRDGRDVAYEIVAGHRRFEAAKRLSLHAAPVIIRDLSDDQAREIALVDNLQREDVPALEEADAYAELQQRLDTPAAIAARVGKESAYVAKRLQLVKLGDWPRKALSERLITVDHALLLARLGAEEQDANLKWCLSPGAGVKESVQDVVTRSIKELGDEKGFGYWEPQSVLNLKEHIEENVGRKLSSAPWSLDDATLIEGAAACNACPKNTKANNLLFGDLAIDGATCEDGACFEAKRKAFVHIQAAKVEGGAKGEPVLRVSWKTSTAKPRAAKEGGWNLSQVFRYGQWFDAKPKSCEFVRAAVTVDWYDFHSWDNHAGKKSRKPGEILTVCIEEKCKVHKKGYQGQKRSSGSNHDPKAEEAKREAQKQAAIAESKIRIAVASKAIEGVKKLPEAALREILLRALPDWAERLRPMEALLPGLKKILQTAKLDSVEFACAIAVVSIDSDHLRADDWRGAEPGRKEFLTDVKRLGYDGSGAWLQAKAEKKAAEKTAKPVLPAKKQILSDAARARITAAQQKRWAAAKKKGGRK